jgi:hypothetical protein
MKARLPKKAAIWATAAWVAFLVLMWLRLGVAQSGTGAATLLLTYGLVMMGTLALVTVLTLLVSVKRRPLRRVVERLHAENPNNVVVLAMGTDDFYLGLGRATAALHPYERGLKRLFVVEISASGVVFWAANSLPKPAVIFEREHVVGIRQEVISGPIGLRATVMLVVRSGVEEIVLPFLVIRDRGTGLLPRDQSDLDQLLTTVTETTGVPKLQTASGLD